jgi:hypothetical protein
VFCIFFGHGFFALQQQENWLPFLEVFGFDRSTSLILMLIIGCLDMIVAFWTLIKPNRYVLIYATFWAFAAALMRPITGGNFLELVERAGNWTVPLILFLIINSKKSYGK